MTSSFNAKNERLKRRYVTWLKESDRKAEATIRAAEHHLRQFELFTGFADFGTFNARQAIGFKNAMAKSGLSEATALRAVNEMKRFFKWLNQQPGFRSKISLTDVECLNLSAHDVRIATSHVERDFATLDQVKAAIVAMPSETEVHRRNRAVIGFILLTQMRDSAVASLRLKHIDLDRRLVHQDPREVKTKFRKPIETFLLPIDPETEAIVVDWIRYLVEVRHFGANDPVFPRTAKKLDDDYSFVGDEVEPVNWETAGPIRAIFKEAYAAVEFKYYPPHTIRHTVAHAVLRLRLSPEELKAFAQNLGHKWPMVTLTSYGHVTVDRQGEILRNLRLTGGSEDDVNDLLERLRLAIGKNKNAA